MYKISTFIAITFVAAALAGAVFLAPASAAPSQPKQPLTGPGGALAKCLDYTVASHGEGDLQYWIFEPAKPKLKTAPVVLFFHGWAVMAPDTYISWIEHIVKRGNIVIYPRYQADLFTTTREFLPHAIAACKDAIKTLQANKTGTQPDLTKVATVGHSIGGMLAANVAAQAARSGLPQPIAVMSVEPGKSWSVDGVKRMITPLSDLSLIPAGTLLLSIAGDTDAMTFDVDAKRIFRECTRVSPRDKNYVVLVSDDHGEPPISGDHFAPCAHPEQTTVKTSPLVDNQGIPDLSDPNIVLAFTNARSQSSGAKARGHRQATSVDAADYYAFWKLFDALSDAAFYKTNRDVALGNTSKQRFMGKWSDGTAVKELRVTDHLPGK